MTNQLQKDLFEQQHYTTSLKFTYMPFHIAVVHIMEGINIIFSLCLISVGFLSRRLSETYIYWSSSPVYDKKQRDVAFRLLRLSDKPMHGLLFQPNHLYWMLLLRIWLFVFPGRNDTVNVCRKSWVFPSWVFPRCFPPRREIWQGVSG